MKTVIGCLLVASCLTLAVHAAPPPTTSKPLSDIPTSASALNSLDYFIVNKTNTISGGFTATQIPYSIIEAGLLSLVNATNNPNAITNNDSRTVQLPNGSVKVATNTPSGVNIDTRLSQSLTNSDIRTVQLPNGRVNVATNTPSGVNIDTRLSQSLTNNDSRTVQLPNGSVNIATNTPTGVNIDTRLTQSLTNNDTRTVQLPNGSVNIATNTPTGVNIDTRLSQSLTNNDTRTVQLPSGRVNVATNTPSGVNIDTRLSQTITNNDTRSIDIPNFTMGGTSVWLRATGVTTNLFEVTDTNGVTKFAVDGNGKLQGDGSQLTGITAGTSGAITNNDTRDITQGGLWTFSGGISAPGVAGFSIYGTGQTTNNTAKALWTNSVTVSNAYSMHFWATASGPTNKAFFISDALFWRDGGDLVMIATNQSRLGSNLIHLYVAAENTSNAVIYGIGGTNEDMSWSFSGFGQLQTNGWVAASGGGGGGPTQLDPSTNVYLNAYYDASEHSGLADGTAVTSLSDASGAANLQFAGGGGPTKQTVGGNTVLRFDGVLNTLYTGALEWNLNFLRPDYGVIVARFKPAANTQAMLFSYQNSGGDLATMWAPYDGTLYFDWQNPTTGRVQASEPAGWTNSFHTLVIKRTVDASNNLILRVDGVTLATATASSASFGSTTGTFVLGARPDGAGNFWAGDFDAMAFFEDNNMSLSDADAYGEWMANH